MEFEFFVPKTGPHLLQTCIGASQKVRLIVVFLSCRRLFIFIVVVFLGTYFGPAASISSLQSIPGTMPHSAVHTASSQNTAASS